MYRQRLNKISAIKAFTLIKAIITRKVIKTNKPRSIAILAPKASIAIIAISFKPANTAIASALFYRLVFLGLILGGLNK